MHAHLLDVVDLDAAPGQGGEQALGDARPVLAAHRHQVGRRHASGAHGVAVVLYVDPALPLDPAAHDARRHAGDHAAVGDVAADDRPGRHHDVLADLRARAG